MKIKQKIWGIPLVSILIFAIGISITYKFTSDTYNLLLRTDNIHYPYLLNIQSLSSDLKGIQESLVDAIEVNGGVGISLARQKADDFRATSHKIATIEGQGCYRAA